MLVIPPHIQAAVADDDAAAVLAFVDAAPSDATAAAARTTFQSGLLHLAAAAGAADTLRALLARPAFAGRVADLDYGGLRRTPLHHACQRGHVACVEALLAAGADPELTGASLATLIQGAACGQLLDTRSPPAASPASLAASAAVQLVLDAPAWTRGTHRRWPPSFRAAVFELLMLNGRRGLPRLDRDVFDLCCAAAAYPVSAWA